MIFLKNILPSLLIVTLTIFLVSCEQKSLKKEVLSTEEMKTKIQVVAIDTFSTFPPEIDGCSCYFSNNSTEFKAGFYIYVNDFAQMAFLKINGIMTKFEQTEFLEENNKTSTKVKYKNDTYDLSVEVQDGKQNGEESMLKTGKIILKDKSGKTIIKEFFGECGC